MDLGTVEERLKKAKYRSVQQVGARGVVSARGGGVGVPGGTEGWSGVCGMGGATAWGAA